MKLPYHQGREKTDSFLALSYWIFFTEWLKTVSQLLLPCMEQNTVYINCIDFLYKFRFLMFRGLLLVDSMELPHGYFVFYHAVQCINMKQRSTNNSGFTHSPAILVIDWLCKGKLLLLDLTCSIYRPVGNNKYFDARITQRQGSFSGQGLVVIVHIELSR